MSEADIERAQQEVQREKQRRSRREHETNIQLDEIAHLLTEIRDLLRDRLPERGSS